ncbi:hypothetical protein QJS04_geneDACA006461 [Acorus gramineus]|uniref:PB1 domain-containing protein n=1 Tax=Acorus gramineus TaxID=55184 RepID=A0AAV9AWT3_ACOGR|nr:hypothetical protein QJS04_geneDACA006461 [Acorus gramineus]
MENHSSSSHPDSHESSPPSRETDCENGFAASWDDQSAQPAGGVGSGGSFRVKFMCSYGGKIEPRPHDNQLSYFGGETKILAVDRSARFSVVLSKLSSLCGNPDLTFFKYQLPGEDLDALISVTNDEDLEHMMMEYDRVHRSSPKPARLRLFLFLPSSAAAAAATGGAALPPKPDREWFIDALNSVPPQLPAAASPAAAAAPNPDFLFGLDKAEAKEPVVAEAARAEIPIPDRARDDRTVLAGGGGGGGGGGEGVGVSSAEIQRQIQELQRLQILGNQEQAAFLQGKTDEAADHHLPPKPLPLPPAAVTQVPATYWQDRFPVVTGGGYASMAGTDQPMLLIPVPAARTINGGPGQGYYVYREQQPQMYGTAAPNLSPQCTGTTDINGGRKAAAATDNGGGFAQVAYHGAGRPVYYMAAPVVSTYQTVVTATPEGKKTPQAS